MIRLPIFAFWILLACLPGYASAMSFSFAVVGDCQPSGSGTMLQNEVFRRIIADVKKRNPAFVILTGDHVWGYQRSGDMLRRMWREYFRVAEAFKPIPVYHAPGNHDIYDAGSRLSWDGYFNRRYSAVEYGRSAIILLDTETNVNRVTGAQFKWLKSRLAKYQGWDNIFVAMHKPVFRPMVDGTLYEDSASLDSHPAEYARLVDALTGAGVRMVFAGHCHMYDMDYRHGILQFISGGGGGAVFDDPVRGFHHYLWVHVDGRKVDVQAVRVSDTDWVDPVATRRAPFVLEDFESADSPLSWTMWDQSVLGKAIPTPDTGVGRSFLIGYDFSAYEWPILLLGMERPERWEGARGLSFRAYAPPGATAPVPEITVTVSGLAGNYSVSAIKLKPGWNKVSLKFSDRTWNWSAKKEKREGVSVDPARSGPFTDVDFMLWGYERKDSGSILLDDITVN